MAVGSGTLAMWRSGSRDGPYGRAEPGLGPLRERGPEGGGVAEGMAVVVVMPAAVVMSAVGDGGCWRLVVLVMSVVGCWMVVGCGMMENE